MKKSALLLGFIFINYLIAATPVRQTLASLNSGTFSFGDILSGKYNYQGALPVNKNVNTILKQLDDIANNDPKSIKNNLPLQKLYSQTLKDSSTITPTPSKTLLEEVESTLDRVRLDATVTPTVSQAIGDINQNPIKTTYILAVLGDSMVDTLGRTLPQLKKLLQENYPQYTFALLNYGFGSTNIEDGLYRLTHGTKYLGKYFPPLLSFKPDILVVESFAYNHWTGEKYDLDRQWLTIAKIKDTVLSKSPQTKIILASSIAPNALTYGDGVLNWSESLKWQSAQITKSYLENLIKFASSENLPLADAFNATLGSDGNGLAKYISSSDNLHPSEAGKLLFSQKIIAAMKNNELLK